VKPTFTFHDSLFTDRSRECRSFRLRFRVCERIARILARWFDSLIDRSNHLTRLSGKIIQLHTSLFGKLPELFVAGVVEHTFGLINFNQAGIIEKLYFKFLINLGLQSYRCASVKDTSIELYSKPILRPANASLESPSDINRKTC